MQSGRVYSPSLPREICPPLRLRDVVLLLDLLDGDLHAVLCECHVSFLQALVRLVSDVVGDGVGDVADEGGDEDDDEEDEEWD